jgi:exonuclease-1
VKGEWKKRINKFGESFTNASYMVKRIIKSIKGMGVKYIIAPYEADAQLAYLYNTKKVSCIITEDSDLIAYGVGRLLYKIDISGQGYELNIHNILESPLFNDPNFDNHMFLTTWILSGCDYLEPIKGIGFKTAYKLVKEHQEIYKILENIKSEPRYQIPGNYKENFDLAYMTFKFQIVYDEDTQKYVHLSNPDENEHYGQIFTKMVNQDFCGKIVPNEYACDIWSGKIDPSTFEEYDMEELYTQFKDINDPYESIENIEDTDVTINEQST